MVQESRLIKYGGYELLKSENGYESIIDGVIVRFNDASVWKKYIDKKLCQEQKDR